MLLSIALNRVNSLEHKLFSNKLRPAGVFVKTLIRIFLQTIQVVDALNSMKSKVIEDFERLLAQLNRGYTNVNYCGILQMISFI